jgi:hypothetical protein
MDRLEFAHDTAPRAGFELANGTHVGIVWQVASDGLAILFERGFGFCYEASIPDGTEWTKLVRETRVEVCISGLFSAAMPSLTLLRVLGARVMDTQLHLQVKLRGRKERGYPGARVVVGGALIGDNLNYTMNVKSVLDSNAADINALGVAKANLRDACRAGYVAEADHVATFNTEASFRRSDHLAVRQNSNAKNSPDIQVLDGNGNVVSESSLKVYQSAEQSTVAQRGYGDQERLVPADQLDEVISLASQKSAKDAAIPDQYNQGRSADYQEVADNATDHLTGGGNESQPRTREESQDLGNKAKDGNVTTADIVGSAAERMKQGAIQGAKYGAIGGAAISAVAEGVGAVRSVNRGEKTVGEAAGDFAVGVAQGTAEGALKGAVAGAATAGARVLAEKATITTFKSVLGGAGPAAIAITTIDVAISAVGYACGTKTGAEFRSSVVDSIGSGVGGAAGATFGAALGPIGILLGGAAGAWLGTRVGRLFSGLLGDDALEDGVSKLLLGGLGPLPGPEIDGALQYRIAQFALLIDALDKESSLVYPGRVLRMPNGYQLTADLLLAHRGTIWAVDFRAWKGELSFFDNGEMQGGAVRWLRKARASRGGILSEQRLRNPIQDLMRFANAANHALAIQDARWRGYPIKPIVVYPDGVTKTGGMEHDARFVDFSTFKTLLAAYGSGTSCDWMPEGLMSIPTWDIIQGRNGIIQQGLISGGFDLRLDDGSTHIPYEAIIKLEIGEQAGDYRQAKVTFRQQEVLKALLPKQYGQLNRKGREDTFSLHDMDLVYPANMLLSR